MNNAVCEDAMENLRDRIDVKLVRNKKDYLKQTSKPSYMQLYIPSTKHWTVIWWQFDKTKLH